MLGRCLCALAAEVDDPIAAEVVLVLNGADADVTTFVDQYVQGTVVLRSPVNLGFAGGCNLAARQARGAYLVFLNDDTEVNRGWLEALVRVADTQPRVGAVGSRILFPDGRLQEAGSLVWRDGSAQGLGRGASADSPPFLCS